MFELTAPSEEFKIMSYILFVGFFGTLMWLHRDKD